MWCCSTCSGFLAWERSTVFATNLLSGLSVCSPARFVLTACVFQMLVPLFKKNNKNLHRRLLFLLFVHRFLFSSSSVQSVGTCSSFTSPARTAKSSGTTSDGCLQTKVNIQTKPAGCLFCILLEIRTANIRFLRLVAWSLSPPRVQV